MKIEQSFRGEHSIMTVTIQSTTIEGHSMMTDRSDILNIEADRALNEFVRRVDFDTETISHFRKKS